jgi:hypothetical protein
MTTYKIKADPAPPPRSSSAQNNHSQTRRRSATIDNSARPAVVTTIPRQHKPVIHSGGGRPASPMKDSYRSSQEDYYTVPGNSQPSHSHHKRYSTGMDTGDMSRTGSERPSENRLRIGSGRQEAAYSSSRPRSTYATPVARRTDPVGGSYGDDEYGYTRPGELVQYDLNQPVRRPRRNSIEANHTSRPVSISSYADVAPRGYETRDRGPPPTTRGFDRIPRGATWEQTQTARMPAVPPPPKMDPVQRPARVDPYDEPPPPTRRNSLTRPVSLYHDRERERTRDGREYDVRDAEPYTVRDAEPRRRRDSLHREERPKFDSPVEQRGFGVRSEALPPRPERGDRIDRGERSERPERVERFDRPERADRGDRPERIERHDRHDKPERSDRPERSERMDRPERGDRDRSDEDREHKNSRDLLTTGLGLAGAALGIKTLKNARDESRDGREKDRESRESRDKDREFRDEREDRQRREYDDESRRRRDNRETREERSPPLEAMAREPRERRDRDDERERAPPQPRDIPQAPKEPPIQPRDIPPTRRDSPPRADRELRESNSDPVFLDLSGRNPQERPAERPASRVERPVSRGDRDGEAERRERRRVRTEVPSGGNDSRSDSPSEGVGGFHHPRPVVKDETSAPAAFNPKDTMDLKALKEALNSKENASAPREEPAVSSRREQRASVTRTSADADQIRDGLNSERRSRERLGSGDNIQPRVVSPPRPKADKAPVKGILRQPKEKFPEDPSPIREGVAPLKDAKKDGVPPDARWTKISRKLVNPEALELGKERYEARDDFVIVLRVLSRDEVQGYAEVTQKLRGMFGNLLTLFSRLTII